MPRKSNKKNHYSKLTAGAAAVITLTLFLSIFSLKKFLPSDEKTKTTNSLSTSATFVPTTTFTPTVIDPQTTVGALVWGLVDVYNIKADGTLENANLFSEAERTKSSTLKVAYHRETDTYAVISGTQISDSGSSLPTRVQLIEPGKRPETIFTLVPKQFEDTEYFLRLVDLNFDQSGQKLAITTSDGMYLYNRQTKKVTQLFRTPLVELEKGSVYGYFEPKFSADGSKILFKATYYEWYEPFLFDLSAKQLTQLTDYSTTHPSIYGGDSLIGWFDNNHLLVQSTEQNGQTEEWLYQLSKISLATGAAEEIFSFSLNERRAAYETELDIPQEVVVAEGLGKKQAYLFFTNQIVSLNLGQVPASIERVIPDEQLPYYSRDYLKPSLEKTLLLSKSFEGDEYLLDLGAETPTALPLKPSTPTPAP